MESRATCRRAWSTSFGRRWRERDDEGLSLIEVVTAITILALVMVMTVGPTLTAFATLRRAKIVDVAEAFAESRIEMARQLQFEQVGIVGGSPSGELPTSSSARIRSCWTSTRRTSCRVVHCSVPRAAAQGWPATTRGATKTTHDRARCEGGI